MVPHFKNYLYLGGCNVNGPCSTYESMLLHDKKGEIKFFFLSDCKKFQVSFGSKPYLYLESEKHFHIDFNSTVKYGFGGVCSLGIFCVCSFSFFFFFRLHNDPVWHKALICKLPAVLIRLASETQSSKNIR